MTTKTYQRIKLFLTMLISIVVSTSIIHQNFFIPAITLVASFLVLLFLRKKVEQVISDERDILNGGKSALMAIQIYSWIAVISMLLLYSLQGYNPNYEAVALTLAFSTCILMLVYSAIFYYYNKMQLTNSRSLYLIGVIIIFLFLSIFMLRVFSGEDSWMCENGKWIEHGHPSYPAPNKECK